MAIVAASSNGSINHDKTRAAVLLGISPKTLYNKIARYKIRSVKRADKA